MSWYEIGQVGAVVGVLLGLILILRGVSRNQEHQSGGPYLAAGAAIFSLSALAGWFLWGVILELRPQPKR